MNSDKEQEAFELLKDIAFFLGIWAARFCVLSAFKSSEPTKTLWLAVISQTIYLIVVILAIRDGDEKLNICFKPQVALTAILTYLYVDSSSIPWIESWHLQLASLCVAIWGAAWVVYYHNRLRLIHFGIALAPLLFIHVK